MSRPYVVAAVAAVAAAAGRGACAGAAFAAAIFAATVFAVAECAPRQLHAQSAPGDVRAQTQDWMWQWSPLRRTGDIGLPAPRTSEGPRLLDQRAPRIGLTWTAGNPASLAGDVDSAWTRVSLATSSASGSYRRPTDAGSAQALDATFAGWRRIGDRLAVAGRIVVEDASEGTGGMSAFASPLASSPFAPTDTNRPARALPGVRLEGAEAITLGRWQLGVAIGFRALENHASHSGAAMSGRASAAGGTLGATHALGRNATIGLSVQDLEESETVSLIANPQTVRVYALDGYRGVEPTDIGLTQAPYRRRRDDTGLAWTLGATGVASGTRWTAFAEARSLNERQATALSSKPPTDQWESSGARIGAALQRTLRGAVTTLNGEYSTQAGDAVRAAATGGAYHADASAAVVTADVRSRPSNARWTGALLASLRRDWQQVADKGGRASTDIAAWSPGTSLEVARRVDERWSVAAGYGVARYTPFATLPPPAGRGVAYQTLIAPEIEISAATARSNEWSMSARRRTPTGNLSFRLWHSSVSPLSRPDATVPLPFGSRSAWGFSVSVEPRQ